MTGIATTDTILLVEDEILLAVVLEEELAEAGFATIGPVGNFDAALEACRDRDFALALLDVNLNGKMVYPLADVLVARGIPFIFLSGYSASHLPERFRDAPRLAKPCDPALLIGLIRRLLADSA